MCALPAPCSEIVKIIVITYSQRVTNPLYMSPHLNFNKNLWDKKNHYPFLQEGKLRHSK